MCAHSSAG